MKHTDTETQRHKGRPRSFDRIFRGSAKILRRGYSPPGTGGVAAPLRKRREATEAAQTGWSDRRAYVFAELTTPAAPSKVASRHLLDGASTPPVPGGEYPRLNQFGKFGCGCAALCVCGFLPGRFHGLLES